MFFVFVRLSVVELVHASPVVIIIFTFVILYSIKVLKNGLCIAEEDDEVR